MIERGKFFYLVMKFITTSECANSNASINYIIDSNRFTGSLI